MSLREKDEEAVLLLTLLPRDSTHVCGRGGRRTGLWELGSWRFSVVSAFTPFCRKPRAPYGVRSAKAHDTKPGRATDLNAVSTFTVNCLVTLIRASNLLG